MHASRENDEEPISEEFRDEPNRRVQGLKDETTKGIAHKEIMAALQWKFGKFILDFLKQFRISLSLFVNGWIGLWSMLFLYMKRLISTVVLLSILLVSCGREVEEHSLGLDEEMSRFNEHAITPTIEFDKPIDENLALIDKPF